MGGSQLPTQPEQHQKWALCFYDDVLQFTGAASSQLAPHFLAHIQNNLNSPKPALRQAALYGVGMMAEHGENAYTDFCVGTARTRHRAGHGPANEGANKATNGHERARKQLKRTIASIATLVMLAQEPDSRNDDNVNATENGARAEWDGTNSGQCTYDAHGRTRLMRSVRCLAPWVGTPPPALVVHLRTHSGGRARSHLQAQGLRVQRERSPAGAADPPARDGGRG